MPPSLTREPRPGGANVLHFLQNIMRMYTGIRVLCLVLIIRAKSAYRRAKRQSPDSKARTIMYRIFLQATARRRRFTAGMRSPGFEPG